MRNSVSEIQSSIVFVTFVATLVAAGNATAQIDALEQRRRESNAAMNSQSSRQAADQAARLQALARKNAANRARVQAAYKQKPPEAEYTRTGRRVLHDVIEKNITDRNLNADAEYLERLQKWEEQYREAVREYEERKAASLKKHEAALMRHRAARLKIDEEFKAAMKPFRSARTGFVIIGTKAQVIEPTLSVDAVLSKTEFVCVKHKWLCEFDTSAVRGKELATEKLIFEVLDYRDAKELPAGQRNLFKAGTKLVRIRITGGGILRPVKKPYPPAPKQLELPPRPDPSTRPTPEDVPEDAREFQINGTAVVCSYIRRLRVRSRKYDVFFAVRNGAKYYLAWCPFTRLSKQDQEWIGAEDRRRREAERQADNDADSDAAGEGEVDCD